MKRGWFCCFLMCRLSIDWLMRAELWEQQKSHYRRLFSKAVDSILSRPLPYSSAPITFRLFIMYEYGSVAQCASREAQLHVKSYSCSQSPVWLLNVASLTYFSGHPLTQAHRWKTKLQTRARYWGQTVKLSSPFHLTCTRWRCFLSEASFLLGEAQGWFMVPCDERKM